MNWIDVNKKLPQDGESDLILWHSEYWEPKQGRVKAAYVTDAFFRDGKFYAESNNEEYEVPSVTHWLKIERPQKIG